jgi:hypothetical protein
VTTPPDRPKIYHITHVDNLAAILADGALLSDSEMIERGGPRQAIGMSTIKRRRVEFLLLPALGDALRDLLRQPSRADVLRREDPIVHLEADLHAAIGWAEENGRCWAFSLSNAGANYTEVRSSIDHLDDLDWQAIRATDFRDAAVKEGKQAEFLVLGQFPFDRVERIGVRSEAIRDRAAKELSGAAHRPRIEVRPEWCF